MSIILGTTIYNILNTLANLIIMRRVVRTNKSKSQNYTFSRKEVVKP